MQLDNNTCRQLQGLMKTPLWGGLEKAIEVYIKLYFTDTIKSSETEWGFIKDALMESGGKYHLKNFFGIIEEEAKKV